MTVPNPPRRQPKLASRRVIRDRLGRAARTTVSPAAVDAAEALLEGRMHEIAADAARARRAELEARAIQGLRVHGTPLKARHLRRNRRTRHLAAKEGDDPWGVTDGEIAPEVT